MAFREYLKNRQLSPKTIETYGRFVDIFFKWLTEKGREATEIAYPDLLDYIKYCRERELRKGYINQLMCAVRHYYNYLKYTGKVENNPAAGLYIRGKQRRIPHDLLSAEQLEEIYHRYDQKGLAGKRNKIMLGLMIYQGLGTQELELLEVHHLKLRKGKIEVPGTRRSNRRNLKLEAHQMIDLQEYISTYRPMIVQLRKIGAEGGDPDSEAYREESEKLFISTGSSHTLHGSIDKLMRNLREAHEYFINAGQIRQSRLAIWVKHHDVREVQYMAGHKYVSSTERYQSTNMEDLQKELDKHHPSGE